VEIVRKYLSADEVTPAGTRWNADCNCTEIWNGTEWVADPGIDPRINPALELPPPSAPDVRCAAAAGMTEVFKWSVQIVGQFEAPLGVANGLLGLFVAFFPIGIVATALIAVGLLAIALGFAALADLFDEDNLQQIQDMLYCMVDVNGRLTQEQFDDLPALIDDLLESDIAGAWASAVLSPLGVVGLNRAGVTFANTEAECDPCGWCALWQTGEEWEDWQPSTDVAWLQANSGDPAVSSAVGAPTGGVWVGSGYAQSHIPVAAYYDLGAEYHLTSFSLHGGGSCCFVWGTVENVWDDQDCATGDDIPIDITARYVLVWAYAANNPYIDYFLLRGDGENPVIGHDCI